MITVGIIANPASGKDIRRLIAHGSVFDNQEKVNIVRRVMLGLQAAHVDNVVIMPDYFGIGRRALDGVQLKMAADILDMTIEANQDDSTCAAKLMREMGVGAVVTLGGDGTNRAIAKEIGDVPMMADLDRHEQRLPADDRRHAGWHGSRHSRLQPAAAQTKQPRASFAWR